MKGFYSFAGIGLAFMALTSCGQQRGEATLEWRDGFGANADTLLIHQKKANKTDRYLVVADTNMLNNGSYDMYVEEDGGQFWLQGTERDGSYRSDIFKADPVNMRAAVDKAVIPGYVKPWIGDIYLRHIP